MATCRAELKYSDKLKQVEEAVAAQLAENKDRIAALERQASKNEKDQLAKDTQHKQEMKVAQKKEKALGNLVKELSDSEQHNF